MTENPQAPSLLPLLAVTLGDVAGIGPEVAVKAALQPSVRAVARPLLIGRPEIVARVVHQFVPSTEVRVALSIDALLEPDCVSSTTGVDVLAAGDVDCIDVPPGTIDARAGRAAFHSLTVAIDLALAQQVDGIVTAPLHKESLRLAGIQHPGHTEILADRCAATSHAMMLHLPQGEMIHRPHGLSVAHVTLHTSIASVPKLLTTDTIRETIRLLNRFLIRIGIARPRIGVCALNPHAGEHGLFGHEELRIITPAVEAERSGGINVEGPLPADTLVRSAVIDARYDGLVAMYHEQGHIPFKLIGLDRAVNITLGLPIVRTSPSHGTAFDIAGQGVARADGMCGAIATAARLISGCRSA